MMTSLSIAPEDIADVLYSWKGIIYYEFVYNRNSGKIRDLIHWMDQIGVQLGGITTDMKKKRDSIRNRLANILASMTPILKEHTLSYDELFVHKRDAKPFVSFLSQCSNQFWSLSTSVGQMMIILQLWNDFCCRGNPYKTNANSIGGFFESLDSNIM